MAKSPRAAITRIATTVTARYHPTSGAADGFYLDGRISGRREHRAADITLDREDRGFFYSVYAAVGGQGDDAASGRLRKALDRIMTGIKQPGRNIDSEINELAECAVNVAGRISLQHEGVHQPYFAGIVVRDSELAAVTMGNGCAYLYRNEILYPLTTDDYPLEAIDYNGKAVSGLDVYCAGVAGTVRYSNIAQLQLDDCIIVCNREIMESLGQREILRLLHEAEDQADAAGMITTAAAAKVPGISLQFMIGFIENITTAERTGRFAFSRTSFDTIPVTTPVAGRNESGQEHDTAPVASAAHFSQSRKKVPHKAPVAEAAEETEAHAEPADPFYDEEDEYEDEFAPAGRGRRIAFYLIIAAVCIGSIFAIYNMLFGSRGDNTENTTTTAPAAVTTTTQSTETTEQPGETTDGTEPGETTETTEPGETTATPTTTQSAGTVELPTTYIVVAGDNLTSIARRFYALGEADNVSDYVDLIVAANGMSDPNALQIGQELNIPARP